MEGGKGLVQYVLKEEKAVWKVITWNKTSEQEQGTGPLTEQGESKPKSNDCLVCIEAFLTWFVWVSITGTWHKCTGWVVFEMLWTCNQMWLLLQILPHFLCDFKQVISLLEGPCEILLYFMVCHMVLHSWMKNAILFTVFSCFTEAVKDCLTVLFVAWKRAHS